MKLETFFEKFDLFADAPDAVAKMRRFLVDLALSGNLVSNDPSDEPIALGTRKSPGFTRKIPANWRSGKLENFLSFEYGNNLPVPKRTESGEYPVYGSNGIVGTHNRYLTLDPAIIVGRKGSAGALNICTGPSWTTDVAYFVRPPKELDLRFTYYLLTSLYLEKLGKGIKPGLSRKEAYSLLVAIPPRAEQVRIAAKLDELMALCDRLEAQQKEREERHVALNRAAIARFEEAPTPANLDFLFHDSYALSPADLRKTIFDLAIRGKLVPQYPDEESAAILLERIAGERKQYALQYGFKTNWASKNAKQSTPFPIPLRWNWTSLGSLFTAVTDGDHLPPPKAENGIAFLTIGNMTTGKLDFACTRFVSDQYYRSLAVFRRPALGDILYSVVGATYGRPALVDTKQPFCVQRHIAILKPAPSMDVDYLLLLLRSSLVYGQATASITGTAQPTVPLGALRSFYVPLPPLAEQKRIVAKATQLIEHVDHLEARLATSTSTGAVLLDAIIHELLNPRAEIIEFPIAIQDQAANRAAIGCYVVQRLAKSSNFGRTMLMKVDYLASAHLGMSFSAQYERQAAGPWDRWISEFDAMGRQQGWFTVTEKSLSNGHSKYEYSPKAALRQKAAEAAAVLGEQKAEFDRLLGLFADKTTEEAEIVATLFAAWNDFLIDGTKPSDDEIIREVREGWHVSKQRFTPDRLSGWLKWMRKNRLIPQGRGPRTQQQLALALN